VKPDNRLYGHDHVLARYCGLPYPRPIRGVLQHGWNPTYGLVYRDEPQPTAGLPRLVWNRRNLHCNLERGYRNTVAIGAPFLYHEHAASTPEAGSLLVCPLHGWEEGRLVGCHEAYLENLERIRAGFDRISVCLYWLEYEERAVRDLYAGAGYEVVTNGHRDGNRLLRPGVPIEDMDIGATDRRLNNLDQYVIGTTVGLRHVLHPNARLGFGFDQGFHR